jgi:hypothetical protein
MYSWWMFTLEAKIVGAVVGPWRAARSADLEAEAPRKEDLDRCFSLL